MASTSAVLRFCVVVISMILSEMGCAATEVYQQGGSTAVITQSGGNSRSSTQVIKTPDGQKIITRDGNSTNITIQRNGSSGKGTQGMGKTPVDKDRFTRSSRDCANCLPPRDSNAGDEDISVDEECKDYNGTNIPTRRNGSPGKGTQGTGKAQVDKEKAIDKDCFTHSSRDCINCPPSRNSNAEVEDFPTAEEYKERILNRMRPLFQKP